MHLSQLKHFALCFTVLALAGCVTASNPTGYVNPQSLQVAAMVGNAEFGDRLSLPENSGLGLDSMVVDRSYIAASGRQCRRLRTVDGASIQRVACEGRDGVWLLARDLRTISTTDPAPTGDSMNTGAGIVKHINEPEQALVPSAGTLTLLNQDDIVSGDATLQSTAEALQTSANSASPEHKNDMVHHTLNFNETLWSFAKRTTGDALNWKTIARINGITDAKTLATGTQLLIPVELVGQGG